MEMNLRLLCFQAVASTSTHEKNYSTLIVQAKDLYDWAKDCPEMHNKTFINGALSQKTADFYKSIDENLLTMRAKSADLENKSEISSEKDSSSFSGINPDC